MTDDNQAPRIVVCGRIPKPAIDTLRTAGEVWAWDRDEVIPTDVREDFLKQVLGDEVVEALDKLPFEFRMTVLLADMHDFSYKEIAEVLECPVGTVMSRLHRARKMLQAQLFQYAVDRGVVHAPDGVTAGNVASMDAFRRRRKKVANG